MKQEKLISLLIPPTITIKEAMQKLGETQEKILFVVDENNRLLGTVNDGDIRRGLIKGLNFVDDVHNIMHRKFYSVSQDTPKIRETVKQIMSDKKIEQIPVLGDEGAIVDVILWTDILGSKKTTKKRETHHNQIIIMAGGKGTRLDPFTRILPKPLIPIGNKPVIEHIMASFHRSGFSHFIYTLNYKKEYLKLFLKENVFSYTIDWIEEEDYLGTAGSLGLLHEKIKDTFFVINCDSLIDIDFEKIFQWHKKQGAAITIVGCHNEVKIPYGVLEIYNGKLERIHEKPVHDFIINTGLYIMEPCVLTYIDAGKRMDMDELLRKVGSERKICVYPIYKGWIDIGQLEEYKNTLRMLGDPEGV
jgi:dTDP-glucose pyrophosphorylase